MSMPSVGERRPDGAKHGARRQLVSNDLLEHAARLFAEKGFAGTSLKDIADSMGISRPSIYNYVANKEELLAALVHDVIHRTVQILTEVSGRADLHPGERLELIIREMVIHNARNSTRFRMLDRSEPHLPPELGDEHRQARRRVLELLTQAVRDASRAGFLRPLPDRTVALGLLGLVNWVAWWYRPAVDGDPEAIADVLLAMAMSGIRRGDDRVVGQGPLAALALLKEDIAHLERTLAGSLPPDEKGGGDPPGGHGRPES